MNPTQNLKKAGFTLIELLTVVAIIGVLASIIISTVAGVRASSRRAVCASNLRQIYLGFQLYINENKTYPATYTPTLDWRQALARGGYVGSPDTGNSTGIVESWQFSIFGCPEALLPVNVKRTTYAMNGQISKLSPQKVLHPSFCLLVADGPREASGTYNPALWKGGQVGEAPHKNSTNVLYCDGHISAAPTNRIPWKVGGDFTSLDVSRFWN